MKKSKLEDWMKNIKQPISPDEPLDDGLAPLIKLMNNDNMWTLSSCVHIPCLIFFNVEDENWFLDKTLPKILMLNNENKYSRYTVDKVYSHCNDNYFNDDIQEKRDKYGNQYCWMIRNNWATADKFIEGLMTVFKSKPEVTL
jgi:hypothetical protein